MKFPENYRSIHPLGLVHKTGDPFGWFQIPMVKKIPMNGGIGVRRQAVLLCVQADGSDENWQHVSVSTKDRCPTWDEMCFIKDLFWSDEETVVQYHPPKSDYVNIAQHCLHLWRYNGQMPRPPKNYV